MMSGLSPAQGAPRRQPRRAVPGADADPGMGPAGGRGRGRGRGGRGGERKPPPGTPGESSGLQVVVHNLPWSCTPEALAESFVGCGDVDGSEIIQDNSGRSRLAPYD